MKAVTFGEIMLRLKTPEYLRIVQAQNFEASYGGGKCGSRTCHVKRRSSIGYEASR